jgi:gluconate 2-dehydrogenase alpha chain
MATQKTDVVIVGAGAVGGVMAAELGKAGMKVIALERGPRLSTADFTPHDELRYFQRLDLRPNPKRQPVTWRVNANTVSRPDASRLRTFSDHARNRPTPSASIGFALS